MILYSPAEALLYGSPLSCLASLGYGFCRSWSSLAASWRACLSGTWSRNFLTCLPGSSFSIEQPAQEPLALLRPAVALLLGLTGAGGPVGVLDGLHEELEPLLGEHDRH